MQRYQRNRHDSRGIHQPLCVAVVLAALLPCAGSGIVQAGDNESVTVRGRVTDVSGAPVPGHTVRLLKSRTIMDLGTFKKRGQNVEELRDTSDAHGFFEFTFPFDKKFRYYYLRFYNPKDFDLIKYVLPEDKDISRRARKGRPVQADIILKLQPGWPAVESAIREYGAGSQPSQILRALGLPERRTPQGQGRELWEYDAAGVSYLLEDGMVLETRRTRSVQSDNAGQAEVPTSDPDGGGRR